MQSQCFLLVDPFAVDDNSQVIPVRGLVVREGVGVCIRLVVVVV